MFKHTISKQIKITNQLSSVKVKHLFTSTFVPLHSTKLTLGFIFPDAISFLLLVRFEVAANKIHTISSGQAQDTGK